MHSKLKFQHSKCAKGKGNTCQSDATYTSSIRDHPFPTLYSQNLPSIVATNCHFAMFASQWMQCCTRMTHTQVAAETEGYVEHCSTFSRAAGERITKASNNINDKGGDHDHKNFIGKKDKCRVLHNIVTNCAKISLCTYDCNYEFTLALSNL